MWTAEHMWTTWRHATEHALYGEDGFYRRTSEGPHRHFRTSVHASPLFARAVLALARSAGLRTVVDLGSGRGELIAVLRGLDPSLRLVGVEVADRPADLPTDIEWTAAVPAGVEALVVANEWLDNVPVDVVERVPGGVRVVEVDPATAEERLGGAVPAADLDWLERWWPLPEVGHRAEVGRPRDEQWGAVVGGLRRGVAVAVDYAHALGTRPAFGTLTGYRGGRQVAPVPDGSCDITSHVALDACAAAGEVAGAAVTQLTTQRVALHALGVDPTPPPAMQTRRGRLEAVGPSAALEAFRDAGEAAELTDRGGLGGFGWLVQTVGMPLPPQLSRAP